ncbi:MULTISPECIES: hypothetical protein [Bacillus cereus group]|nr:MULTISPECIES: hypothetical protein [unclassified Bacillus cereus group]MDA2662650.1 hypothetical protein [Bacillus cereus group sp. Bc032]MDA2673373.1 hypothetical protein [Bacillus cereus group sp. Bc031]MDA2678865.1 hypothetical protein [Bacillus cereus group sp. Bc029]MDA2684374.1 hypothetical protein [Bacillus cereus group sp. Bc030]MDA2739850.1 hypothetical protein [Bacillus cereus group sp. Bc011]
MTLALNRWGNTAQDRDFRNRTNENWEKIEGSYTTIEENNKVSIEMVNKVKNTAVRGVIGKNLFDKSTVTRGKYVVNNTGNLADSPNGTHNASDFIELTPNTPYRISGTSEQGAFYDVNKNYIIGFTNASSVTMSPPNAYFIRITVLESQLNSVQAEKGTKVTEYEPFSVNLDANTIKTPIPEEKLALNKNIVRGIPSKNLFDKSIVIRGKYVVNNNGTLADSPNGTHNASDFIPIIPNTNYKISGTTEQGAFYDSSKNFISGFTNASSVFLSPSNAHFIRMTVLTSQLDSAQLEKGTQVTEYEPFGAKIQLENLGFDVGIVERIVKTVKPDGTGDYLSPKLANDAIIDASAKKIYDVVVHPGTYTEVGWTLKSYINLRGVDAKTCWLKGELPDNATDAQIDNTSTLWIDETNDLENITVTAKNMRYAVHDESSNAKKNWNRSLKKSKFLHYGNEGARTWRTNHPESGMLPEKVWVSECAYGMGHSSGSTLIAEDCEFRGPFAPFSVHNNVNFENPCLVILKRCEIIKTDGQFKYALRVQSLGSKTSDKVILEGCRINGEIYHDDKPWLGDPAAASHKNFTIEGFANSEVPYSSSFTTEERDRPNFSDEYNSFKAKTSILKGQAVCFDGDFKTIRPMTDVDDNSLFAGIAIENINVGNFGKVKVKGFVSKLDLYNFSGNITFGVKYGAGTSGSLVINEKAVAIGVDPENIKII